MSDTLISTMRQDKTILRKRLPPEARDKLAGLGRGVEDAKALSAAAYDRQQELHLEKDEAPRDLHRLEQADQQFQRTRYGLFKESREDLGGGNYKITKERDLPRWRRVKSCAQLKRRPSASNSCSPRAARAEPVPPGRRALNVTD